MSSGSGNSFMLSLVSLRRPPCRRAGLPLCRSRRYLQHIQRGNPIARFVAWIKKASVPTPSRITNMLRSDSLVLTAGFTGPYQFNVVVPNVAASDSVPFTYSLGGVAGPQNLIIAVQN
jgi:hypothetical protein